LKLLVLHSQRIAIKSEYVDRYKGAQRINNYALHAHHLEENEHIKEKIA
jgi:hypothetical protein